MATQHNGKSMGGARTIVDKSVKAEVLVYLKILGIIVALIPVGYFCFFLVFVFAVASPSVKKFDSPDRRFDVKVESYGLFSGDGSEVITLESKSGQAKSITEITGCAPDILWNTNRIVSINFSSDERFARQWINFQLDGETLSVELNSPASVSDDCTYIAKLERTAAKQDPVQPIFVERVDFHRKWHIAEQDLLMKRHDVQFLWRPQNRLYLVCDNAVKLKMTEIKDGGTKIHISLLPLDAKCPE